MADKSRILIIDDEEGVRETLGDIFEEKGYLVDKVVCGEDAVEMVKNSKFDIVFVDMKLPGEDGFETYRKMKKIDPSFTGILMTAYQYEFKRQTEKAFKLGARICLTKPFDPQEAVDIVEKIFNEKFKKEC